MNSALIRDFIKTLNIEGIEKYYVGKLDSKYENSICIYSLELRTEAEIGTDAAKTNKYTILLHGTKNYTQTENLALEIYKQLNNVKNVEFNDVNIDFIYSDTQPRDIHTDENGIYERVIDFYVYYREQ